MLSSLPLELFDLVNQSLSTQDKYNCLFVCQAWYPSFRLALYQHCILTSIHSCRSLYSSLQNGQASGLGGQVRVLDTSQCELAILDLKSLFRLCPNVRDSRFRWHSSYSDGEYDNQTFECQQRMWNHQAAAPVWPATNTDFTDQCRQRHQCHQRSFSSSHLSLCGSLTQLTLHDADLTGLFSLVTHLPLLEQLSLISVKLDMNLDDMERIHATCPRLSSLSLDIHTLLSTATVNVPSRVPSSLCNMSTLSHMRRLKLIYKSLEKPGRSPWIRYLAHKYPRLTSLEMQTRFVHRRNYWQWNRLNSAMDNELTPHQQQQQEDALESMDDHPEFRSGLKQWAQSCRYLLHIHFAGIPWDRWFLKHLPVSDQGQTRHRHHHHSHQQQQLVKHVNVVRVDDDLNAAAATFATLVNHPSLNQLTHLTLRPVATHPDISFYKALGQLGSLTSLTIQQQGIRSNKLSPCQVDVLELLASCQKLEILAIGGMAALASKPKTDDSMDGNYTQAANHKQLRSLSLSTTTISHATLQQILSFCPSLSRFYFISCEYEAALEHGIPTLALDHPGIQWKEVHIRYPFIQSPQMHQYHQPIGLSGSRRRGGTPRYLSVLQHNDLEGGQWIYLNAMGQKTLAPVDISTIMGLHQKDNLLRQEGLEFGRIKVVCHSIQSLCINGSRIHL